MITIKSLEHCTITDLYKAFQNAFADYEMQLDQQELEKMLQRRGFDAGLSFGAFDGDKLVAFTFNGIGNYNGVSTAYDTGTGTTKKYRSQGLAKKIFLYSIPYLRKAGVEQYLLEVLQHNEGAYKLYSNLGFKITREFYYYKFNTNNICLTIRRPDPAYRFVEDVDLESEPLSKLWDFNPSWQNSIDAVLKQPGSFRSIGVYIGAELVGYVIIEPESGDITQLVVGESCRRKGIASILLSKALKLNKTNSIKIINNDVKCESYVEFLDNYSIKPTGKQYEMVLRL